MGRRASGEATVAFLLAAARRRIDAIDARALLTALTGRTAAQLIAHDEDELPEVDAERYAAWVARRAVGEPVAYITGEREFYGRSFAVTPDVLIPRPETELLVELVLAAIRGRSTPRILELGTGSGCIAVTLALERSDAIVTAVDVSAPALAVARRNAADLKANVQFAQSDWYGALGEARYDVIAANPPYVALGDEHLRCGDVRFEPQGALAAGDDGLDAIRRIVSGACAHLDRAGWLMIEHGYEQGAACRGLLTQAGLCEVATHRDLARHERVTAGRMAAGG